MNNRPDNKNTTPAITLHNVCKDFETVEAVKDVSFSVEAGEFVTLLGPSGSGKSTLLSLLAGFERPSKGSISLNGTSISDLDEDSLALIRRTSVGFVFQAFHLIPTLNSLENVTIPLYPVKMEEADRNQRAQNLLDQVGLRQRAHHLPAELSGGERQRVAIARALVNKPDVLFCDEPTGNLDSKTGKEILELLMRLNSEQNVTLFMVTHDKGIANLSSRTLYMQDGAISNSTS